MFYILLSPFGMATKIDFIEVTDDLSLNEVIGCDSIDVICMKNFALIVDDEFLFKPNLLPNLAASNLYDGLIFGNAILTKYTLGSEELEPFNTVQEAIIFLDGLRKGGVFHDN